MARVQCSKGGAESLATSGNEGGNSHSELTWLKIVHIPIGHFPNSAIMVRGFSRAALVHICSSAVVVLGAQAQTAAVRTSV